MNDGRPSTTALRVARRRAEHQTWDAPVVFTDPLAALILGAEAEPIASTAPPDEGTESHALRAFVAVRSRFAEDALAAAVAHGVRQYVILGAGLDTFAYRNPHHDAGLRVFEVDHPATQAWKRERVAEAKLAIPESLTFVPVDFARSGIERELEGAGFDRSAPAFFSWLGVTMYLLPEVVLALLRSIAEMPAPAGIAFDYRVPRPQDGDGLAAADPLAARVAAAGEPFRSAFEPRSLAADLRRFGFDRIEDLDGAAINERYYARRADGLRVRGGSAHLVSAVREQVGA
jgi:methyltransferase (TIGR00027 family)